MGLAGLDRAGGSSGNSSVPQLLQAQSNQFSPHVHVEYEWWLGQDDMYESDEDLDEKVRSWQALAWGHACCRCPRSHCAGAVPTPSNPQISLSQLGPVKKGSARPQSCCHPPAAAPRLEAAGTVPWGGWPDSCPPPAAHLCSLDVPPAPSYAPPIPPQRAKPGESLQQGPAGAGRVSCCCCSLAPSAEDGLGGSWAPDGV